MLLFNSWHLATAHMQKTLIREAVFNRRYKDALERAIRKLYYFKGGFWELTLEKGIAFRMEEDGEP